MVTKVYLNYIKSERWQQKRREVFAHYGKKCYACGTTKGAIHVHHLTYARLGHERVSDLIPLCVKCHKEVTRIYRKNRYRGLHRVTMEYVASKKKIGP